MKNKFLISNILVFLLNIIPVNAAILDSKVFSNVREILLILFSCVKKTEIIEPKNNFQLPENFLKKDKDNRGKLSSCPEPGLLGSSHRHLSLYFGCVCHEGHNIRRRKIHRVQGEHAKADQRTGKGNFQKRKVN